jgi:hypothetical protein
LIVFVENHVPEDQGKFLVHLLRAAEQFLADQNRVWFQAITDPGECPLRVRRLQDLA